MMRTPRSTPHVGVCCVTMSLLWLAGCADFDAPPTEAACGQGSERVLGSMRAVQPVSGPVRETLLVQGTALHLDGLAIRQITVGGVRATPLAGAFNFAQWQAELPLSTLLVAATGDQPQTIEVRATTLDACGRTTPIATLPVAIDPTPQSFVTDLNLAIALPSAPNASAPAYLPTTTVATATVTVTANAQADGATTRLRAEGARFVGATDADPGGIRVVLRRVSETEATATAQLTATTSGPILLSATSGDQLATTTTTGAGPVAFAPAEAILLPGQSTRVTLLGAALPRAGGCTVNTTGPSLRVTTNGAPLTGSGSITGGAFTVRAADAMSAAETTLTVTCQDVYGQTTTGTYTLSIP